jgi:hypothetical protein
MILLIDDYVIILLAEEVRGSLGFPCFPYIIIWCSLGTVPVIIALCHKLQCDIEGTKEKRTLALGVRMHVHRRYKIWGYENR